MLTPAEFKRKELVEKKRHYYDKDEVDFLLEDLSKNYEELYSKYEEMARNAKKLSDGVQYYKGIETTLQKALVLAEKTAKETTDAAELKAATIENDARLKAKDIIAKAEKQKIEIQDKCIMLVDLFKQYKSQFIQVTNKNLTLLNSSEFEINGPELEKMYAEKRPETEKGIKKQLVDTQDLVDIISNNLVPEAVTASNINPVVAEPEKKEEPVKEATIPAVEVMEETLEPVKKIVDEEIVVPEVKKKVEPELEPEVPSVAETKTETVEEVKEQDETKEADVKTDLPEASAISEEDKEAILEAKTKEIPNISHLVGGVSASGEAKPLEAEKTEPKDMEAIPSAPVSEMVANAPTESEIKEKSQTLDALLSDLNMNNKKSDDEDPFEFLGSLDDF